MPYQCWLRQSASIVRLRSWPPLRNIRLHTRLVRHQSTQSRTDAKTISYLDRFIAKTPTVFLRTRLTALRDAPVSHIVSFLVLHEITAVVPLFGLTAFFHYFEYLPAYFAQGEWAVDSVKKFGNYFRKKGWISSEDADKARMITEERRTKEVEESNRNAVLDTVGGQEATRTTGQSGEDRTRLLIEFATAYAVVKVLFIPRIMVSVWGAPWFARFAILPIERATTAIMRR